MSGSIRIRHAEPTDANALHALFSEQSAYAATLQLPYPSLVAWQKQLQDMPRHAVQLIAETADAGVVGAAGFEVFQNPRRRHAANIGMAVSPVHRGKGVGSGLLQAVIETAEQWHGVRRLELEVYSDNEAAIALYRKHGFVQEGMGKGYALRDGRYVDVLLMARLATD